MDSKLYDSDYMLYQMERGFFRRFIRGFYLDNILKYVNGRAIDFGCGIGALLARLPEGSIGLEINKSSVDYCRNIGLNAKLYDPDADKYQFNELVCNEYKTFIMIHVLEHLDNPVQILGLIAESCKRLGVKKVIIAVPGLKGFSCDKTHNTHIDLSFLKHNNLTSISGYSIAKTEYFPINKDWAGKYFAHNELIVIYE